MNAKNIEALAQALAKLVPGQATGVENNFPATTILGLVPLAPFDVNAPRTYRRWATHFERYRIASGLSGKTEQEQISAFLYIFGPTGDEVSTSLRVPHANPEEPKIERD